MSFAFGLLCNDAALFQTAQIPFRADLTLESGAPNGWGLAYYQAAQPLLHKQPKPFGQVLDFSKQTENLRTNVLLAHVRAPSAAGRITENTQPFRFRGWTFCHVGTITDFERIVVGMKSAIPHFMRRNIRGTSDSEVLFYLFLAFLNDANQLDNARAPSHAVARALRSTLLYVDRLTAEQGSKAAPYCCIATNGRVLIAAQSETPLLVKRNASYTNLGHDLHERPSSYPHLKAVAIIGGREAVSPGWEAVVADAIVAIDTDLNIEHFSAEA